MDAQKRQAGKFEISREAADITDVIGNRVDFFNLSAADRKITLTVSVADSVPKALPFDVQRIKQVLNNLVSNGLKFTAEGGTISIAAFMHEPGSPVNATVKKMKIALTDSLPEERFAPLPQSLVVAVSDTGMGISSEHIPELFSKFKQLDNKALVPNIKGTGLGLAIAKGIIEGHGGIIGVVSKVGAGSTFYFALPVVQAAQ